jgi:hypothetical protein
MKGAAPAVEGPVLHHARMRSLATDGEVAAPSRMEQSAGVTSGRSPLVPSISELEELEGTRHSSIAWRCARLATSSTTPLLTLKSSGAVETAADRSKQPCAKLQRRPLLAQRGLAGRAAVSGDSRAAPPASATYSPAGR